MVRETQVVTIAAYRRSQPPVFPSATGRVETAVLRGLEPKMGVFCQNIFMKNLALLGGAPLAAAVPEPWPLSVGNHKGRSGV